MLFNSWSFIVFWVCVLVLLLSTRNVKVCFQNIILLASSYLFYCFFSSGFLLLLLYVTLLNFYVCRLMGKTSQRRFVCAIGIVGSIVPLLLFKYTVFFITTLDALLSIGISNFAESWVLPVGISFFTFQALSYTIDVYRKKTPIEKSFISFALFVAFFPTILSGPIEKARNLLPQIHHSRLISLDDVCIGCRFFVWGVFKKMVIADRLAQYVDYVYAGVEYASSVTLILAALLYSVQIYCDFSGYSDMALGIGRSLGFRLTQNFNFPYFSTSIKSFWKKWHISLTSWFTEYVYFSLGGNRVSRWRWVINISLVFLLSGIWHGAATGFFIWGGVHALLYLVEHLTGWSQKANNATLCSSCLGGAIVFVLVSLAWVFFRLPSWDSSLMVLSGMLTRWNAGLNTGPSAFTFAVNCACLLFFILSEILIKNGHLSFESEQAVRKRVFFSIWMIGVVLLIELFCVTSNQFVYFQF